MTGSKGLQTANATLLNMPQPKASRAISPINFFPCLSGWCACLKSLGWAVSNSAMTGVTMAPMIREVAA